MNALAGWFLLGILGPIVLYIIVGLLLSGRNPAERNGDGIGTWWKSRRSRRDTGGGNIVLGGGRPVIFKYGPVPTDDGDVTPSALPEAEPEVVATAEPPAAPGPREYRVWFGTNRAPEDPEDLSRGFSDKRGKTVHHGHCDVLVPEAHKVGSTGSPLWKRLLSGTDDRLKLNRIAVLAADDYWRAVAAQIKKAGPGKGHALVFIHGYRVSFEDAAIRAAQIGFDLGIEGAMAFFSWASHGALDHYSADEATIQWSEGAIADFIADFAAKSGAEQVHVIAHSMGNRGLLGAVNRILHDAEWRQHCGFGQIILAAADVDAGLFARDAGAYRELAKGTTLYVSEKDKAVELSGWLHVYDRVGFAPPVAIVPSIETVSVTGIDMTLLGHGYVAEARPVIEDMGELIHYGTMAEGRTPKRLVEKRDAEGRRYWAVKA